jgi:hypothetical protein
LDVRDNWKEETNEDSSKWTTLKVRVNDRWRRAVLFGGIEKARELKK